MKPAMKTAPFHPITTRYSLPSRLQDWDDHDSWHEFFETYSRLIYSVAMQSGLNEMEAEDVLRETVISVARDLHKFKRERALGSFRGWLRNIIRWRVVDYIKQQVRLRDTAQHWADLPALEEIADPAGAVWEREWQTKLFNLAVDRVKRQVKAKHYQMFDLYVVQQVPVPEIARRLGVTATHIYVAKHRISSLIRKKIKRLNAGLF